MYKGQVGRNVRELRMAQSMSQEDLAAELQRRGAKISRSYLSQVERENRVPSGDFLVTAAELFGVSVDYILGLDTETSADRDAPLTEEAIKIAEMVDLMAGPLRRAMLEITYQVQTLNTGWTELRQSHDLLSMQLLRLIQQEGATHVKARAQQLFEISLLSDEDVAGSYD